MPTPAAMIQYGELPEGGLVDEPNLLVQSLTISPQRTKRTFQGGNGATFAVQFRDPQISFAFRGYIQAYAGMGDAHPGSEIAELANFDDTIHGFDPADGVMVFEEPSRELDTENPAQLSATVVQYPFVEAA